VNVSDDLRKLFQYEKGVSVKIVGWITINEVRRKLKVLITRYGSNAKE
jgi:hypothetical protein